jgi:ribosomal-protein-alanine acetyltransferase
MLVRTGTNLDLPRIAAIQRAVSEASQWDPAGYQLLVAECEAEGEGVLAGFLVWRRTVPEEAEILNLAVLPEFRRRGIGSRLIEALPAETLFLEVRESNLSAIGLYRKAGFEQAGVRSAYYADPVESAMVMRLDRTLFDRTVPDQTVFRIPVTDVFDLHTVAPRDVEGVTEAYLEEAYRLNLTALRLIHGRGIGVQRDTVRRVLARTAFVVAFCDAPAEAGGWGATLVTLSANENHVKPT